MRFGLSDDVVRKIETIFEQYSKVDKVIVFGSRAKGNYKDSSDIDLAVKGSEVTEKDILNLHVRLSELNLPYEVDLLNYHTIKEPELKAHIDRVGIEIYSRWKEYKFSELLVDDSISYGIVQPGSHTEIDSVPIIRVNNIKNGKIKTEDVMKVSSSIEENYKRTRLTGGELLITVVGSVGECAIVPDNLKGWNVARAISVARIKDRFDKRFIKYAFKTDDLKFQMYGSTNDTVQPTLNLSLLKELKFILPSLSEQTSIASILTSLDDKIDLLHRQNKILEQLAETLFRHWFVEEAKESWKLKPLSEVCEIINGFAFKSEDYKDAGRVIIRTMNFEDGYVNTKDCIYIDLNEEEIYSKQRLKRFDFLLVMVGASIGKFAIVTSDILPALQNQNMWNFRTLGKIPQHYLNFALRSIVKDNSGNVSGSARDFYQKGQFYKLEILIPDEDKLNEFNLASEEFYTKIENNRKQIALLEQTRDVILPKLISGEVRVTELNTVEH